MNLLIMGPQGAGKGSICEALKDKLGIATISTGDMFRTAIKNQTELGKIVEPIINAGNLVDDNLTIALLKERLKQDDCKNGWILDGFPRTLAQAKELVQFAKIDKVIYLNVDKNIIIDRISGRRTCPQCSHIHNIKYSGDPSNCSVCGTKYVIRDDDKSDAIKKRLETFERQTLPAKEFFAKKGLIMDIDASKSLDQTIEQVTKGLEIL